MSSRLRAPVIDPADLQGDAKKAVLNVGQSLNSWLSLLADSLNGNLTFAENMKARIVSYDITMPDEWVPLSLQNSFQNASAFIPPFKDAAYRIHKTNDGYTQVQLRGLIERPAGAPAANTVIATGPEGIWRTRLVTEAGGADGGIRVVENGDITYLYGAVTSISLENLYYEAVSTAIRPQPNNIPIDIDVTGSKPISVVPISCSNISGKTPKSGPIPHIEWQQKTIDNRNYARINYITGLPSNIKYKVTFLVIC